MPLFRTQSAAEKTSLAPHDSKARLLSGRDSQGFMAKPCTPHPIAQRVQLFEIETANVGGRGVLPSRSPGGPRGIFSHVREYPPYPQPHTVRGKAAASSGCPPPRTRGEKEDFSFEKPSLFTYFLLCRSNYSASCIAFAAATAFACASAEHCS